METLVRLNCSTIQCNSLSPSAPIWQDVLAQAMTGELIAAMNYTSLSEICDDPEEVADALEHAESERGHAAGSLPRAARSESTSPTTSTPGIGSGCARAFMRCVSERDFIGCLIVQEIMLESFAVASYARVGKVAPGSLGQTFAASPPRKKSTSITPCRFSERSERWTRSASTTRCTGCIWM